MILKVKRKVHKTKVRPPNNFYWNTLWLALQRIWLRFSTTKLKNNRGESPKVEKKFHLSIIRPMHLVPSLYDKVEKLVMEESPKTPLVKLEFFESPFN